MPELSPEKLLLVQIKSLDPEKPQIHVPDEDILWEKIESTIEAVEAGYYASAIKRTEPLGPDGAGAWITRNLLQHWTKIPGGKEFLESAFREAGLPEIEEGDPKTSTLTNLGIAQRTRCMGELTRLLKRFSSGTPTERRLKISLAVNNS